MEWNFMGYWLPINFGAFLMVIFDKWASRQGIWRLSELSLLVSGRCSFEEEFSFVQLFFIV